MITTNSEESYVIKSLQNQINKGQRYLKLLYVFVTLHKYFFKKHEFLKNVVEIHSVALTNSSQWTVVLELQMIPEESAFI